MRWARVCLCALIASSSLLVATVPVAAAVHATAAEAVTSAKPTVAPDQAFHIAGQTPWVTPTDPWYTLDLGVGSNTGPLSALRVEVTFYNRIDTETQFNQSLNAVPDEGVNQSFDDVPVMSTPDGRLAAECVTVLPDEDASAPAPAAGTQGVCPPGAPTVTLGCTPGNGTCGDVYPVSVALYRQGTAAPLSRFTTFLTYQEPDQPGSPGPGGALRVGLVVPLASPASSALTSPDATELGVTEEVVGSLWAHRALVPVTLAPSPTTASTLSTKGDKAGRHAVAQVAALATPADGDQMLSQPFVPIDVAAMAGAGLTADIEAQMDQGDDVLRQVGLHPAPGTWVDTDAVFTTANGGDLATGLGVVNAKRLILNDTDLAPAGSEKLTFAQPFTLSLGHGATITAAAADTKADALFTADPDDPVLAANQLLATLEFIHFENAFTLDPRGVVLETPQYWHPGAGFLSTLLAGLTDNPALAPVTLDQFFAQVHKGGNDEPVRRHLQSGAAPSSQTIGRTLAQRLTTARTQLASFTAAATGHPAVLGTLSNLFLATENGGFDPAQRVAALATYTRRFNDLVHLISLAAQGSITFTSTHAPIPVSVLSSAPFPVKVVLSLDSDKFTFPDGSSRTLTLDRPTTPVRIAARARTSGDRLPVEVTLTTPDGQLVFARAALTVHSTSISIVGIALTVLAGLVLLVWWFRTWRKRRTLGPRAH
jgi:Family of unknown function (DUF6049)